MGKQWMNFVLFSLILVGIILASVIFGGYSSLHRSEGRIDITKGFFLDSCQSRLDLLPQLLDFLKESEAKEMLTKLKQAGKEASTVLHYAASQKSSLDRVLTLKLEKSQSVLTKELIKTFFKLEQSNSKKSTEAFQAIKKQFFSAQNKVFAEKMRYNTEVRYFNRRTKIFPGFLIAKLFGFNKSEYFELSKDLFLGANDTFEDRG
jgi:LemA protein